MSKTGILVLFTGNSERSIPGEALLGRAGAGRVAAYSAGSRPAGSVNPGAIRLLIRKGFDVNAFRSKSWTEVTGPTSPHIDIALTVCGSAAGETCPVFPGSPARGHWGLSDPALAEGDEAEIDRVFERTFELLEARVNALLALPFETMDRRELEKHLAVIGAMEGAA